jgi:NAD(P)-dependent dehydrogenase (short-subunit alcohol dehydrogenase family)
MAERDVALIVGAGSGLSASLAQVFAAEGLSVALAAREPGKLDALAAATGAQAFGCDAAEADEVARLFEAVDGALGSPAVVIYNPSARVRGAITELDPAAVEQALKVTVLGGFLVAQQAARRMLQKGRGTILFTGASANVKGYPRSASFAMGKFGLRGLAQSLARELQPQNIHVAHIVIDGAIASRGREVPDDRPDSLLDPDAIARSYLELHRQHRSAWASEIELRPWTETF